MKLEGSPKEIRDHLNNSGFNSTDYFEMPSTPLKKRYLIVPAILFLLSLLLLELLPDGTPTWQSVLSLSLIFGNLTWLCASTQLRFKNGIVTLVVASGSVITFCVVTGLMSPKEVADWLQSFRTSG
ncbi:MAG: hypothetical protein P9L90_05885 [Candidatus Aadella gelida]|nr:hypothetical protein [Candidatus Aadella gelida]